MDLSNKLSCEAGSFSCCRLKPHGCFHSEVSGFISPCWSPGLQGLLRSPTFPPGLSMCECGAAGSASCSLARPVPQSIVSLGLPAATLPRVLSTLAACLRPGCPSPTPRLAWMNVSSLSPWLSDFHTVRFSVSSGCFLFLNCPFWLCKEVQCVYLCLHLGWKPTKLNKF